MSGSENLNVPENVTQEDLNKALKLLESNKIQRAKNKERVQSPEYKAKMKAANLRRRTFQRLLVEKAVAGGITVSDAEVDAAIEAAEEVAA